MRVSQVLHLHPQGSARRRRDRQPQADAARRPHPRASPAASTPGCRWACASLRKVEAIVREEMNRAGALELLMPAVQPAELWQESGALGAVRAGAAAHQGPPRARLLHRPDARGGDHRHRARASCSSYRQLPVNFYQIQTKFRDEIRPRFGVMRGARVHHEGRLLLPRRLRGPASASTATCTTPTRASSRAWACKFRAVAADTGAIGGTGSHEFHVLADSGEDAIAYCPSPTTPPTSSSPRRSRPRRRAPRRRSRWRRCRRPARPRCEDVAALLDAAARAHGQGDRGDARRRASSCCCCAATTR